MKTKLPVRPIPFSDESPAGYLLRICEANGFPSVTTMAYGLCKPAYGDGWVAASYTRPERYQEILNYYGLDKPEAVSLSYERAGPTADSPRLLDGAPVPECLFGEEARAYCPVCLEQRKYFRKRWSLRPYAVCLEHSIHMQMDCHACRKPLSPLRGLLARCECGASLTDAPRLPGDAEPVEWWLRQVGLGDKRAEDASACVDALLGMDPAVGQGSEVIGRLRGAKQWLEQGVVSHELRLLVRGSRWHPRIVVLPLLESDVPAVQHLAHAILRAADDWTMVEDCGSDIIFNRKQAELALGVSPFQMTKMQKEGVWRRFGFDVAVGMFSAAAIHSLLCRLAPMADGVVATSRPATRSIVSVVEAIVDGKEVSAGFPMAEGIRGLRSVVRESSTIVREVSGEVDVHEAARIMKTYPEAIRFLAKTDWIEHRTRDRQKRKRWVADRAVVERLAAKYVLAGEVAAQARSGVTSTSERLMAMGLRAVSGPKIDGALVYMFERDAVNAIDLSKLRGLKGYPTSTGRKRTDGAAKPRSEMTLSTAAALLGLSVQTTKRLVVSKHLQEIHNQSREVVVTRASFDRIKGQLDDIGLVPVDEAAAMLGMGAQGFEVTYVQSGIVNVIDLGISRRVHRSDIDLVRVIREKYLTSDEAGRLLGLHRSHLPNLERRGEITSLRFGKVRSVRFYAVSDVKNLIPIQESKRSAALPREAEPQASEQGLQGDLRGGTYESQ